MKTIILLLFFPLFGFTQSKPNNKLTYKVRVNTDSGTVNGYFVKATDSTLILSPEKRYMDNSAVTIPVNTISALHFKTRQVSSVGLAAGAFVFGFILTAGLTKNGGDIDNDGKTSFFELLFTAIEGTTSRNRRRRNTALIVGAAGGTSAMVLSFFTNKKLSLVFPINDRNSFFRKKKYQLNDYIKF